MRAYKNVKSVSISRSLSVDILQSWSIWMKIAVYAAMGLESGTSPSSTIGSIFRHNLGRGVTLENFRTPISQKLLDTKMCPANKLSMKIPTNLILYICSIFQTIFSDIKFFFWKKLVRGKGSRKRLDLGQNTFKMFVWTGKRVFPRQHSRDNTIPKLGVLFYMFRTPVPQKLLEIPKWA